MNRSWTQLRRAVPALAFIGTLGFGATQAIAVPTQARFQGCPWSSSGPQFDDNCYYGCTQSGFDFGYCENGQCQCTDLSRS
jgi:hypothetical protein